MKCDSFSLSMYVLIFSLIHCIRVTNFLTKCIGINHKNLIDISYSVMNLALITFSKAKQNCHWFALTFSFNNTNELGFGRIGLPSKAYCANKNYNVRVTSVICTLVQYDLTVHIFL